MVAFKVPRETKSTPARPAFKLAVAAFRFPVALMPPATCDAFKVNEVAELAASDT